MPCIATFINFRVSDKVEMSNNSLHFSAYDAETKKGKVYLSVFDEEAKHILKMKVQEGSNIDFTAKMSFFGEKNEKQNWTIISLSYHVNNESPKKAADQYQKNSNMVMCNETVIQPVATNLQSDQDAAYFDVRVNEVIGKAHCFKSCVSTKSSVTLFKEGKDYLLVKGAERFNVVTETTSIATLTERQFAAFFVMPDDIINGNLFN